MSHQPYGRFSGGLQRWQRSYNQRRAETDSARCLRPSILAAEILTLGLEVRLISVGNACQIFRAVLRSSCSTVLRLPEASLRAHEPLAYSSPRRRTTKFAGREWHFFGQNFGDTGFVVGCCIRTPSGEDFIVRCSRIATAAADDARQHAAARRAFAVGRVRALPP